MEPKELEHVLRHYIWQSHMRCLSAHGIHAKHIQLRHFLRASGLLLRYADQLDLHKLEIGGKGRQDNNQPHLLGS